MFPSNYFLDFHTHSLRGKEYTTEIISLHHGKEKPHHLFTIGFHPWYTSRPLDQLLLSDLAVALQKANCLGLGEVGLDKLKGAPLHIQENILKSQLSLAQKHVKPVVIHCVRAYDPLLKIKKQFPSITKWCVHGYGRNAQLARQLIKEGFYISIMPGLPELKYRELAKAIPIERLFLETDSWSDTTIESVYEQWSHLLNIKTEDLCLQMNRNASEFFGR